MALCDDLPPKVIPMTPSIVSTKVTLSEPLLLNGIGKVFKIRYSRKGFNFKFCHAITSYFSQGQTFTDMKCLIDLRLPPNQCRSEQNFISLGCHVITVST